MPKETKEKLDGTITGIERNGYYVTLDNGWDLFAHLSGNMRRYKISLTVGDRVTVEISIYDVTKGRIVKRLDVKNG